MSLAALWGGAALALAVQEPRVTFEHRAARVERLFPALSQATGLSFTFSPQTKDEVLIVSVRDVPLGELRAKIAEAASAEWQAEEGGFRLIRSAKLLQKLEAEHLDRVAEQVKTAQELLAKDITASGNFSDAYAVAMAERLKSYLADLQGQGSRGDYDFRRVEGMRNGLPGFRLASRLAALLDPQAIAAIPSDEARVFSTAPNRMQLPFPKTVSAALSTYAEEAARLAKALPREPKMPEGGVESNVWQAVNLGKRTDFVPAKVLLRVPSAQPYGSSYLQLTVADAEGKVIDRAYLNLSPNGPNRSSPSPPKPEEPVPGEKPIPVTALSNEFSAQLSRAYRPDAGTAGSMSPALRSYLANPEENETTGLVLSDRVLGTANALKLNVVFSPTFAATGPGVGSETTPTLFLNRLKVSPNSTLRIVHESNWLVARPADWVRNRDATPNRRAVGRLIREGLKRKLGLEDFAALAAATEGRSSYNAAFEAIRLALPLAIDNFQSSDFTLMQLHGGLNPSQRQTLAEGRTIPAGNLSPWQQTRLARLVFGQSEFRLEYDYAKAPRQANQEFFEFFGSILSETTECYPNGIPPQAALSFRDESDVKIRCSVVENGQFRQYMEANPGSLAYQLFAKERPDVVRGHEAFPYNEFAEISVTEYRYELRTQPLLFHQGSLRFTNAASATAKSIEGLPKGTLERIQAELTKIREQYKNYKPPGR